MPFSEVFEDGNDAAILTPPVTKRSGKIDAGFHILSVEYRADSKAQPLETPLELTDYLKQTQSCEDDLA